MRLNTALSHFRHVAVTVAVVVIGLAVLPVGGATGAPMTAWTAATAPTPLGSWYGVAYGDGRWVAVGNSPDVAVSLDGSTWSEYPAPAGSWQPVTYGDGRFVALSSTTTGLEEMTSTNGVNWTTTSGPTGEWTGLTYGGGRFVAVGTLGQIVTSTNAANWTVEFSHSKAQFTSVAYGNGRYVAVDGALGATVVSPNGTGWSYYPSPVAGARWGAVAFGNGNFVALDDSGLGAAATSVLGYVWTAHQFSPAQFIEGAAFGCGAFVADGQPAASADDFFSSPTGAQWAGTATPAVSAVPTGSAVDWTSVAYGAGEFVAVDNAGDIASMRTGANCSPKLPMSPQQVSGNIHSGEVWTYMHPPARNVGAPIDGYRVTITDGSVTKQCSAPVYYEPNCIIRGLRNRAVYSVTTQSHNRFGWSVPSDPEYAIPVDSWSFDAVTARHVTSASAPVVVQVTGVLANGLGIYPSSHVTLHFGALVESCLPSPFGECLITVANPIPGSEVVYATYTGYGRSYRSPAWHVTVVASGSSNAS